MATHPSKRDVDAPPRGLAKHEHSAATHGSLHEIEKHKAKEQFKKEEQPSKPKEARFMDKHKEVNSQRVRRKYQGPTAVAKKGGLKGWGTEADEIQDALKGRQGAAAAALSSAAQPSGVGAGGGQPAAIATEEQRQQPEQEQEHELAQDEDDADDIDEAAFEHEPEAVEQHPESEPQPEQAQQPSIDATSTAQQPSVAEAAGKQQEKQAAEKTAEKPAQQQGKWSAVAAKQPVAAAKAETKKQQQPQKQGQPAEQQQHQAQPAEQERQSKQELERNVAEHVAGAGKKQTKPGKKGGGKDKCTVS